jgi:hypothetical protein
MHRQRPKTTLACLVQHNLVQQPRPTAAAAGTDAPRLVAPLAQATCCVTLLPTGQGVLQAPV